MDNKLDDNTPIIYSCMPGYNGQANVSAGRTFYRFPTFQRRIGIIEDGPIHFSLLAFCHNMHWGAALSYAKCGKCTHFYMQHTDVEPEAGFMEILLDEQEKVGCDVISGVIAIKGAGGGVTSTAIDVPEDNGWGYKNLTLAECYKLPETFCNADVGFPDRALLVNTGCMLIDLRGGWAHEKLPDRDELRLFFHIDDRILVGEADDGEYKLDVQTNSEDWNFSRTLFEMGRKVYATTAVRIAHHGNATYFNDPPMSHVLAGDTEKFQGYLHDTDEALGA